MGNEKKQEEEHHLLKSNGAHQDVCVRESRGRRTDCRRYAYCPSDSPPHTGDFKELEGIIFFFFFFSFF